MTLLRPGQQESTQYLYRSRPTSEVGASTPKNQALGKTTFGGGARHPTGAQDTPFLETPPIVSLASHRDLNPPRTSGGSSLHAIRMHATSHPPIPNLAARPLELLLLGCSQASNPSLCNGSLNRILVDEIDDELQLHQSPAPFALPKRVQPTHDDGVSIRRTVLQQSCTPFSHNLRLEITPSLQPVDSARYHSTLSHNTVAHSHQRALHSSVPASRSLTTSLDVSPMNMTTIASAPGSPPDLSGSRSSKSSSYCSTSQDSNPEPILSDITNFEEIGLDDDRHGTSEEPKKHPLERSKTADATVRSVSAVSPFEKRPALPSLHHQVREAVKQNENGIQSKKGGTFSSMRRGFSSPITPLTSESSRPRSSSPPNRLPSSHATTILSADLLRSQWNPTRSSLPLPSRRSSWQQRKSVQELEAEYNDSDDELPEDASLWNVPVSPHVGDRSARSSFHGSPSREAPARSPRPIPLAHAVTAPEEQLKRLGKAPSSSRLRPSPRSSSLTTSLSNPSSPRSRQFLRSGRARSWNLAMEDLSEEAKIISEALDYHAITSKRAQTTESGSSDSLLSQHAKPHQIQLPPVQKSNLDFMPISKEKEAILSRTRPSWLPPKDPREERRHLKEYQRMMAASLEADKKRQDKLKSQECENDTTREALDRIWAYYCEESTDLTQIDKRVFDLCWRGISPKIRGKVWQRAVGNPLGLTTRSYEKALARAHALQSKGQLSHRQQQMNDWFKDIERDAETAFPELNVFQKHGPMWQDLIDVCKAYACYRSDIGYLYGQQLTAALLLLQVPNPADAFILLANCLNRPVVLAFQSGDLSTMARTYNHAVSTLAIKFPRLHNYLFGSIEEGGLGFTSELIFQPMFRTLFCNGLDIDRLCRTFDLWVFEGDKLIVRAAVAILGCLQSQLFEVTGDIDLRRRNIQEMLAWGPFNRNTLGGHWDLHHINQEKFVDEIRVAGELDYRLK